MLCEIRELGFSKAELSHGIRMSLVPGILRALEENVIEVSSIHNFCPLPSAVDHAAPNLFQPSSKRRLEISMWYRYTLKTMEFAKKVDANKIVIHSGSSPYPIFRKPLDFEGIAERSDSSEFEKSLTRLRDRSKKPVSRVLEQFRSVHAQATELNLQFGVENREGVYELPVDSRAEEFFEGLPDGDAFGYWHDTGHAQLKHRLGLLDHREHLEKMAPRLIGFHLHDVSEDGHDHQVPGSGEIDFSMVREFIEPHHTLVAELSPRLTEKQVIASRDFLLENLS